jgi:hypothetical protein
MFIHSHKAAPIPPFPPFPPLPPFPTVGGQIVIVLHSPGGAPNPNSLLVKQVLFLTAIPSDASLLRPDSIKSISSTTSIPPLILKVLTL